MFSFHHWKNRTEDFINAEKEEWHNLKMKLIKDFQNESSLLK